MNYNFNFPLMEEEIKRYIISGDDASSFLDLLHGRPGAIVKVPKVPIIHTTTGLRQWWEPIEDEL
jgi:hypothetical protein